MGIAGVETDEWCGHPAIFQMKDDKGYSYSVHTPLGENYLSVEIFDHGNMTLEAIRFRLPSWLEIA